MNRILKVLILRLSTVEVTFFRRIFAFPIVELERIFVSLP